jgi:hypothetical protein
MLRRLSLVMNPVRKGLNSSPTALTPEASKAGEKTALASALMTAPTITVVHVADTRRRPLRRGLVSGDVSADVFSFDVSGSGGFGGSDDIVSIVTEGSLNSQAQSLVLRELARHRIGPGHIAPTQAAGRGSFCAVFVPIMAPNGTFWPQLASSFDHS